MKNSIIALALILTAYTVKAQRNVDRTNFRAGINAGLVVGEFSEEYSFALGVDFYHHWGVTKALDVGITAGFFNAFGEGEKVLTDGITETEFDNLQYLPLGASLRIYPGKNVGFKFGSDIGYAVGVSGGLEGALYYKPSLGIDLRNGSAEFNISYLVIDDDISYSSVLLGYLFLF